MKLSRFLLCSLLGVATTQALACYTVYDPAGRVVYQSPTPPVDMSRPLHETLPARFPRGHMIFDTNPDCPVISSVATGNGGPNSTSIAPLLTDQRTAQAMRVPHKVLPSGVALVQPSDAVVSPRVTVVPSFNSSVPSTAVMGNGPSGGGVITELKDPPAIHKRAR